LWKTNRYAKLTTVTLNLINGIDPKSEFIDLALTREILMHLLNTKGIRLPMASTILRFRNPKVYQIIDQRVYRLIYGTEFKLETNLTENINQYLDYLTELKNVCNLYQIPFYKSDRTLYEYDKIVNLEKIKY
jgi:thermostable 8-oxoguanine DNA glycosylase